MDPIAARGWGEVLEYGQTPHGQRTCLVLFRNEEAPRWMTSRELTAHRRDWIAFRSVVPNSPA